MLAAAEVTVNNVDAPLHRLDGRLYRQELRERGQELKQLGRAITVPDGQIRWRMLMPGPRLLHVQRLARVLAPHVTQLLADAEAHPGFRKALPDGEQLHSELLQRNPLIAPNPQVHSARKLVFLPSDPAW